MKRPAKRPTTKKATRTHRRPNKTAHATQTRQTPISSSLSISGINAEERSSRASASTVKKSDTTIPASAVPVPVPDTGIRPTTLTVPPTVSTAMSTATTISLSIVSSSASGVLSAPPSLGSGEAIQALPPTLAAYHLSPAIITLISVGAACLVVACAIVLKMIAAHRRQRRRNKPTPSHPILQDSPMFGGKEYFSPVPTWTTYSQPSAEKLVPSLRSDRSLDSEKSWGSQDKLFPNAAALHAPTPRPPPRNNLNPVARVLSRLSAVSIAQVSPVVQADVSRIGVAVADPGLHQPKLHRKPAARLSRVDLAYAQQPGPAELSTPELKQQPYFNIYPNRLPSPKPTATDSQGRERVKSIYSRTSVAPNRTPIYTGFETPALPYSFPHPPVGTSSSTLVPNNSKPATNDKRNPKSEEHRQRETQAILASLSLPPPVSAPRFGGTGLNTRDTTGSRLSRLSVPPSPSATSIYPDDSLSVREMRQHYYRPQSDVPSLPSSPNPATTLGKMMLADYGATTVADGWNSNANGTTPTVARSGSGSGKKLQRRERDEDDHEREREQLRRERERERMNRPPPRVPSPPTLPSLSQMALAHADPDYHSPTYSIYGLYEASRKSGVGGMM